MNSMKETHYMLTVDQKSDFYKKMITIAIPVIIQNIISIGLGMADTMASRFLKIPGAKDFADCSEVLRSK